MGWLLRSCAQPGPLVRRCESHGNCKFAPVALSCVAAFAPILQDRGYLAVGIRDKPLRSPVNIDFELGRGDGLSRNAGEHTNPIWQQQERMPNYVGLLDVVVYRYALSAGQVLAHYAAGECPFFCERCPAPQDTRLPDL